MGKFIIALEDVANGQVAIMATGKPDRDESAPASPAEELFIELLELISESTENLTGQCHSHH
jgi:hypothetical protein